MHDHDHDHDHAHEHGHHHDHDHGHAGAHAPITEGGGEMSPYEVLEQAVRELLIEKGVLTAEEIHAQMDFMDSRTPALGAKVIARAWSDPAYKARLLADPRAALKELGIDFGTLADLGVLENTDKVHHVVVCTLCSCYPKLLLGVPPAWYKSLTYRARVVVDPRGVLTEFGVRIPDDVAIRVYDSTADFRYLVLPKRPKGTEGWDEAKLASIVTRDAMVGTAVPGG